MTSKHAQPFIKWAGGKRQSIDQFDAYFKSIFENNKISKYIEPFLGGGAIFFHLIQEYKFEEVILNDINTDLINLYNVVKTDVYTLIDQTKKLENEYLDKDTEKRKKMYYSIRELFNENKMKNNYDEILHASHFLFLNRTCFNGLYRVNQKGEFNVPIGSYKNPTICDEENLILVNKALENVTILNQDYKTLDKYCDGETYIYLDPPYRPLPGTKSFTTYHRSNFNNESQKELAEWIINVVNKYDSKIMASNSDPHNTNPDDDFFLSVYDHPVLNIEKIKSSRRINSNAKKRGDVTELLITTC